MDGLRSARERVDHIHLMRDLENHRTAPRTEGEIPGWDAAGHLMAETGDGGSGVEAEEPQAFCPAKIAARPTALGCAGGGR